MHIGFIFFVVFCHLEDNHSKQPDDVLATLISQSNAVCTISIWEEEEEEERF